MKLIFIISQRENEGYYPTFGKKLWWETIFFVILQPICGYRPTIIVHIKSNFIKLTNNFLNYVRINKERTAAGRFRLEPV